MAGKKKMSLFNSIMTVLFHLSMIPLIVEARVFLNPHVHPIWVVAVDIFGNVSSQSFNLFPKTLQALTKISGDNQHGLPNVTLPVPFVVDVRDVNNGSARQGVWVTFTVKTRGGTLSVKRGPDRFQWQIREYTYAGAQSGKEYC